MGVPVAEGAQARPRNMQAPKAAAKAQPPTQMQQSILQASSYSDVSEDATGARIIGHGAWVLDPEPLGSGAFSVVWRGTNTKTRQVAAVKEVDTTRLSAATSKSLASEIKLMKEMKPHKHICGMIDLIKRPGKIFMVLDYCPGGDLKGYLRRYGRVSERVARSFMRQLADGLSELRAHNVLHRDLKPQNLLLSDSTRHPTIRIADFGFARSLQPEVLASTMCGSPHYMAPEIMLDPSYGSKADLWSVGAILHELLCGKPPFTGANHMQLLQNIEKQEADLKHNLPKYLSSSCRDLIVGLLHRQPAERYTWDQFFNHDFIAGGVDDDGGDDASDARPRSVGDDGGCSCVVS